MYFSSPFLFLCSFIHASPVARGYQSITDLGALRHVEEAVLDTRFRTSVTELNRFLADELKENYGEENTDNSTENAGEKPKEKSEENLGKDSKEATQPESAEKTTENATDPAEKTTEKPKEKSEENLEKRATQPKPAEKPIENATEKPAKGKTEETTNAPGYFSRFESKVASYLPHNITVSGSLNYLFNGLVNATKYVANEEYETIMSGEGSPLSKPAIKKYFNNLLDSAQKREVVTDEELQNVRMDVRKTFEIFSLIMDLVESCRNVPEKDSWDETTEIKNLLRTVSHILSGFKNPMDLIVFFHSYMSATPAPKDDDGEGENRGTNKKDSEEQGFTMSNIMETMTNVVTLERVRCLCKKRKNKPGRNENQLRFLEEMKFCFENGGKSGEDSAKTDHKDSKAQKIIDDMNKTLHDFSGVSSSGNKNETATAKDSVKN